VIKKGIDRPLIICPQKQLYFSADYWPPIDSKQLDNCALFAVNSGIFTRKCDQDWLPIKNELQIFSGLEYSLSSLASAFLSKD